MDDLERSKADDTTPQAITDLLKLTPEQEADAAKLSAVGVNAADIAAALELPPVQTMLFRREAERLGSPIQRLIAMGRVNGASTPQMKLHDAATTGNVQAIIALRKLQDANRFNTLVENMDNDELAF